MGNLSGLFGSERYHLNLHTILSYTKLFNDCRTFFELLVGKKWMLSYIALLDADLTAWCRVVRPWVGNLEATQ